MNYFKKTDWMNITVNVINKTIFIQQKWKYEWKKTTNTSAWTYSQRKKFHHTSDNLLWKQWSGHFKLKCEGTSSFVKKYGTEEFTVNFDIKWVINNEHWNVKVKKIRSGSFEVSSVNWTNRIISLDTEDLKIRERVKSTETHKQYPISHEFGHTVGNSSSIDNMHADEYKSTSAFKLDLSSRMNIGNELRKRHLDYIIIELNKMIPDTKFKVNSLK